MPSYILTVLFILRFVKDDLNMTLEMKCNSQIIALRYEHNQHYIKNFIKISEIFLQFFKPVLVSCHHVANCHKIKGFQQRPFNTSQFSSSDQVQTQSFLLKLPHSKFSPDRLVLKTLGKIHFQNHSGSCQNPVPCSS